MLGLIMALESEEDRVLVLQIYIKHAKHMYLIANNILKNHEESQDAVHDAIENVMTHIEQFHKAYEEEYVKKLAIVYSKKAALKRYRYIARRSKMTVSTTVEKSGEDIIMDIPDDSPSTDDILVSNENVIFIKSLLDSLDPMYKDIFYYRAKGFSNEEIARVMDISVELVRQRTSRARKKILELGGERLNGIYKKR